MIKDIKIYSSKDKVVSMENANGVIFFSGVVSKKEESFQLEKWIKSLLEELNNAKNATFSYLKDELTNLFGCFYLIIQSNIGCFIISDIIRSIPVFYGFHNDKLFITDNLEYYQRENGRFKIDIIRLEEYTSLGLVYGRNTIYRGVKCIQAGEIVEIKGSDIYSERYFTYCPSTIKIHFNAMSEFAEMFDKVLTSVFLRMQEQYGETNRWVVPLSGGHDSRLIVNYMYRLGIRNVICFSYGTEGNEQSLISKSVADALGYDWHFIEYTEAKWYELHKNKVIDEYINFAFNGISTPHLQDFLAIYELKKKGIIKNGDIIVPGHSAITAIGFNKDTYELKSDNNAVNYVYMRNIKWSNRKGDYRNSGYDSIKSIMSEFKILPKNLLAFINWQERQAKFIANSIRTYSFFGCQTAMPFWDKEIVDFWLSIPVEQLMGRKILFESENYGILENKILSIPFDASKKNDVKKTCKYKIKKILPNIFIAKLLSLSKHKVILKEGMNQIYALKANSITELLIPIEDFPKEISPYFTDDVKRYLYQMDSHFITTLYTIRKQLDKTKI
jgi:asparagine synthase (glutamine-hydrolysing)